MTESYMRRSFMIVEARFKETMDALDNNTSQVGSRLRTKWKREDEAWAKGELPPLPEPEEDEGFAEPGIQAPEPPELSVWARWCAYWRRW